MEGSILKNEAFLVIVLFLTVLAAHSAQGLAIPKYDEEAADMEGRMEAIRRFLEGSPYQRPRLFSTDWNRESMDLDDIKDKRGLDFGLGRGHSGSLTAKYLLGQLIANNPNGPGRK
ncbi:unnamed protein product [Darwinula stevensoni]|uniref:Uncharacterized protein n=1 Tax=Darwinula stevensoni TaxID=69355 RepID=A0A7R8XE55_9CRUS|nr:unnamed protein product [Darwinula stevensoni]CAG0889238.1 unnamed protein product [Darwinula stevensoni]